MEWDEKLEQAFDELVKNLKESLKALVVADDRPPNWDIRFRVPGGPWRGIDGKETRVPGEDTTDQT